MACEIWTREAAEFLTGNRSLAVWANRNCGHLRHNGQGCTLVGTQKFLHANWILTIQISLLIYCSYVSLLESFCLHFRTTLSLDCTYRYQTEAAYHICLLFTAAIRKMIYICALQILGIRKRFWSTFFFMCT